MENEDLEIANRFRSLRLKANLSQKEFAQSIGLSQTVIAEIERGAREPSRKVMISIAKEYNISLDWLLLGIDLSNPIEKYEENNEALRAELNALKKENATLAEEIRKIEAECKKLDDKNKEISDELLERLRQLVTIQNQQLGLT
jgi:transcriptional regulator with XRE-family HTH domain